MISVQEFLIRAHLEHRSLEAWIAAGWLIPPQTEPELMFSDIDLARAQLIRDLREDFGVNDEGISVILHLVDQMHGLRRSMEGLLDEMRAAPTQGRRTKDDRSSVPARRMSTASRRRAAPNAEPSAFLRQGEHVDLVVAAHGLGAGHPQRVRRG